jgi:hypothetical protein
MLNASRNCSRLFTYNRVGDVPAYDEQIIARPRAEVQPQPLLWFPDDAMAVGRCGKSTRQKKSRRFRRLLKLITGRRQTEWTGATRCPTKDKPSHKRESLIDRKQAVFFRIRLPCRPLAECQTQSIFPATEHRRRCNRVAQWGCDRLLSARPIRKASGINRASSSRLWSRTYAPQASQSMLALKISLDYSVSYYLP